MAERTLTGPETDPASDDQRVDDIATPDSEGDEPIRIAPGDCLGRYSVLARIGGGGMGEVFAAHDPELSRTVALKIIRQDRRAHSPAARLRLVREAQALARLHHPNVVTVHDVGGDGDRVFVAMELIDGPNVSAWLHDAKRGWREILAHLLAAGRGLAAAHDAGIVHRDFKPDNVIVGKDRVVVIDFGLARAQNEEPGASPPVASAVLDTELTLTGDLLGTPPYMAPEQRAGRRSSAASDQFSFCVSLWEALHGARPPREGSPKAANTEVPGWINDAIRRGLAPDPGARWPSMSALLTELGRDRRAARRKALTLMAALALAGAAAWGLLRPSAPNPCLSGPLRVAEAWGAPRRQAVHAAFRGTASPNAEDTFARVSRGLDDYVARWTTMFGETCRATRVDGRQSDSMMDLRMACLERRRAVLNSLTELWARGMDADELEHAPDAVRSLAPLGECADTRALGDRSPPPSDPAQAALVESRRARLDEVEALLVAHRLADAKTAASQVRAAVDRVGWPLLSAEAAFVEGDVLAALEDPGAEAPLLESARLATASRDDRLAARALVTLVGHFAGAQQSAPRALLVADLAEGLVSRIDDADLRATLLRNRGSALLTEGKYEAAQATLRDARSFATKTFGDHDKETLATTAVMIDLARQMGDYSGARRLGEEDLAATIALLGPDHPDVARVLENLATAATDADDVEGAAGYLRRALTINERVTGPESAATAATLTSLATVENLSQHLDEAERLLERALAIRVRVLGPEHPFVAATLMVLGNVRRSQGRFEEALDLLQRALAITIKVYGAEHPRTAVALHKIGLTYEAEEDAEDALLYYEKALAVREKALGSDHEMTLFSKSLVGGTLAKLHRCKEARPLLEVAESGLKSKVGQDHADYIGTLGPLALCDVAEGHLDRAITRLEHALELEAKPPHYASTRAEDRRILAQALWLAGRHKDALAAARIAAEEFESDPETRAQAREARAWVTSHQ